MQEQLLYILLGAALSIGGGFLAQRNQSILSRKEEDQRLLWEIETYLLNYHATQSQLQKDTQGQVDQKLKYEYELLTCRENLNKLALRLKSAKYKQISLQIIKFCLDKQFVTQQNLDILTRQVQLNINDKIIKKYEKEIKRTPNKF